MFFFSSKVICFRIVRLRVLFPPEKKRNECSAAPEHFFSTPHTPRDAFLKQPKGHDIMAFSWEFNFKSEALGLFTT
jgi:hypothetical protein